MTSPSQTKKRRKTCCTPTRRQIKAYTLENIRIDQNNATDRLRQPYLRGFGFLVCRIQTTTLSLRVWFGAVREKWLGWRHVTSMCHTRAQHTRHVYTTVIINEQSINSTADCLFWTASCWSQCRALLSDSQLNVQLCTEKINMFRK